MKATLLNLQRMSTEDGPGIRTTVFFKGCSLSCRWCHNPESIERRPRTAWNPQACLGCRACEPVCPRGALRPPAQGPRPDPQRCQACGACARECPAAALEVLGREWTLDELVGELLRDRAYFEASGGGVTASGGEPSLWPGFVAGLFARLRAAGVSTALDTCGHCSPEALAQCLADADLVLYDLKLLDPELHRRWTGHGPERVLANARALARGLRPGQRLWIRTPLIPGATASPENLAALGGFIARELGPAVERWELLTFNNLCREQYRRLGRSWDFAETALLGAAELERLAAAARGAGLEPARVLVSGPTRLE
ncbi:MAG TPA: glycyl-radical enzyme activating protein [Myxococcota bacterium]|nr:glycyl-radical enzyme activating protein [Myxococcota bacterium]HRY96222.1 glycyl-radical enzyme activating protein [Myxococcota bacterium]HSA22171.1 glycyl-radical enzyme activating protein [Myxococcota bacterium]